MPYSEVPPDELFTAIGKCLHAWSGVEQATALLFLSLHDHDHQPDNPLRAAFEVVQSIEVRLAMIHASVVHDSRSAPLFKAKWNALYNKLTRLSRKRAQVAHFAIVAHNSQSPSTGETRTEFKVQPFFTYTNMVARTGPAMLTRAQLHAREESFNRTQSRIMGFCRYLWIVRGRPAAFDQLEADPARLLDSGCDRTPKDDESPPQSSQA